MTEQDLTSPEILEDDATLASRADLARTSAWSQDVEPVFHARGKPMGRPRAEGKFLFDAGEKLYVRGVAYGAFRPDARGREYHELEVIERDFAQMAANGINTVRIPHTTPPRALLDVAKQYGLRVMVGLSAEQYVGSVIDRKMTMSELADEVRRKVRVCAGHPALLAYALGNEIPASLVRWLGSAWVERYLETLYRAAKAEDPEGLVTYVNYPTTEYLQLPFLDIVCFNVYLESRVRLEAYLARLHNLAGDRPLLLSEIGLDSMRNGEVAQARSVAWQVRSAFASGCAGIVVFSWTDEWYSRGAEVEDWKFGITRRDRQPKPALAALRASFAEIPFSARLRWPRISVVVCSYNGARTIRQCLAGLRGLEYPDFEIIVVDDGSTDATPTIVRAYGVRLISVANGGLGSARNLGLKAATGEIVAYIDDDAWPDRHWLGHLAATFLRTRHAGAGGPNIAPPEDGVVADCVANSPGGPVQVLLSDEEAEHVPGCNMAFRKECLEAIGGFDPRFRAAGDDVDVCWRIRERGWTLGFSPGAMVWHHRRGSVKAYWKQQAGYGKAEALLAQKWPEKYSGMGSALWTGRIYGSAFSQARDRRRARTYYGVWGSAPFQSLYRPAPNLPGSLGLMPEWYLIVVALAALSALGTLWRPLYAVLPLFIAAGALPLAQAAVNAAHASFANAPRSGVARFKSILLTALLHALQPLARLWGRLRHGLTPWRRVASGFTFPRSRVFSVWSGLDGSADERLRTLETDLRATGVCVRRGDDYARWDLEVRAGGFGAARLLLAMEDCGGGGHLMRVRLWPRVSRAALGSGLAVAALSIAAASDQAWAASAVLGIAAALVVVRILRDCGAAAGAFVHALRREGASERKWLPPAPAT